MAPWAATTPPPPCLRPAPATEPCIARTACPQSKNVGPVVLLLDICSNNSLSSSEEPQKRAFP